MHKKIIHIGVLAAFVLFLLGCSEDPPVANFDYTFESELAPAVVTFSNMSTLADSYMWEFGDGYSSNERDPVHTYEDPGTFTIALTASGKGGKNMMSKSINIIRPTSYLVQNTTTGIILYSLSSYYWDPVNDVAFDVVEHGVLYSGYQTDEVITDRPSIELEFQLFDEPDSTWFYAFIEPVFMIIPNTLNVMDINDNTTIWWYEDGKPFDPLERSEEVRKYSKSMKDMILH